MSEHIEPSLTGGRWKILAAVGAIASALALTLFLKHPAVAAAPHTENPMVENADQAFDEIPGPTGNSASENALAVSLGKARKEPTKPKVWSDVGDALAQRLRDTGDQTFYAIAEKAYRRALSLDPKNVAALNGMAWVTGGAHKFDESMSWANQSLAVEPQNADAYGILGDANVELGDYDLAFTQYQKMMDLRPDLSSWSRGSYLLWLTGDTFKAENLMQQAIRSGGAFAENTAWCRAKLAMMYFHEGSFESAAQTLEPSLRSKTKNPHVLLAAAQIAVATDEMAVAEQYYKLILEGGPQHDALVGLGDLHAAKGEMEKAEKYYKQADDLHAANLVGKVHDHTKMALFLADHDRNLVEAMRLAEQDKLTRNVLSADTLAWVYFKNGENQKAIAVIKVALSRNTPDSTIHYHAGMIALQAGDTDSALRHLQIATSMNPKFSLLQAPQARAALERIANRKAVPIASAQSEPAAK
jgi:tetratricopeptide (TPR) repeat protein